MLSQLNAQLNAPRSLLFLVCGKPLGVDRNGNEMIPNSKMTASSEDPRYPAKSGRLGDSGWSPDSKDLYPYLQIDLSNLYLICGLKIDGCTKFKGGAAWVTRYRVQVSPEKNFWDSWNYIKVTIEVLCWKRGATQVFYFFIAMINALH